MATTSEKIILSPATDLKTALATHNYARAIRLIQKNPSLVHENKSLDEVVEELEGKRDRYEIKKALEAADYQKAYEIYTNSKLLFSKLSFPELEKHYRELEDKRNKAQQFEELLADFQFQEADELYKTTGLLVKEQYEELKSRYIIQYVKQILKLEIDKEKALALSRFDRHLLLKARAGSGKTTVIACKTALLMDRYEVDPDEILILVFNRKAAREISHRIRKKFPRFDNARTFHSLAHELVQPEEDILFDEEGDASTQHLKIFIKNLFTSDWNPAFQKKMYECFRAELMEMESTGDLLGKDDYYLYRKALPQVTLQGERVKSLGEKYIADFLCEHDIQYDYEKPYYWNKRIYRPDFRLFKDSQDFIIEHWGVDEKDPRKRTPEGWSRTWQEYVDEMQEKRTFWREKGVRLIETSVRDLIGGRVNFEALLKDRLKEAGFICKLLPREEVMSRIREFHINQMTQLFTQFIQKAKKSEMTIEDIEQKAQELSVSDKRTVTFLKLGQRVLQRYDEALAQGKLTDFDKLIQDAVKIIETSQGNCTIRVNNRKVKIKELKWILIDEYQDFSKLFYKLIAAITRFNPDTRLFCVGDDWQAINGFAGSDLKYFQNFTAIQELEGQAGIAHLLTNYRSTEAIVKYGNKLMAGNGKPSVHHFSNRGGDKVTVRAIDNIFLDYKNPESIDNEFVFQHETDGATDPGFIKARNLKACYQILSENRGKTFALLYRKRRLKSCYLENFRKKLKNAMLKGQNWSHEEFESSVKASTAHSYKGLEEDIIIILDACDGAFPMLHPDHVLFSVFGQTEKDLLEEERRLFYVAATRAREKLFILTENDNTSAFLN